MIAPEKRPSTSSTPDQPSTSSIPTPANQTLKTTAPIKKGKKVQKPLECVLSTVHQIDKNFDEKYATFINSHQENYEVYKKYKIEYQKIEKSLSEICSETQVEEIKIKEMRSQLEEKQIECKIIESNIK